MNDHDLHAYTARNREIWNRLAEPRRVLLPPPAFFAAGGSTLEACEVQALGPVAGKRMLHLQCASGNETLSWAARGVPVVGVDISEVAIAIAREQARQAGLAAEFVAADVYALPAQLLAERFDVVYASWGVVCWLPDVTRWARVVARCLRPGGTFLLAEHHPLWESLVLTPGGVAVTGDYFGRNSPAPTPPHWSKAVSGAPVADDAVLFRWPVGDVVTALVESGLQIRRLEEHALPDMYLSALSALTAAARASADRLPAVYLVLADKPGTVL